MTLMISTDNYTLFTGATPPENFQALHDYVVETLEGVLGRWIVSQQYTEHIDQYHLYADGVIFTRATPITAVPAGWRYDDNCIYLVWDLKGGTSMPVNPGGFTDYGIDSGIGSAYTSDGLASNSIDYFMVEGIDIQYTGGWTPYGSGGTYIPNGEDPDGPYVLSSDLPLDLAKAIAWGINTKANAGSLQGSPVPMGVQSMNIAGEYSITLQPGAFIGPDGYPIPRKLRSAIDLGGQCLTLAAGFRKLRK